MLRKFCRHLAIMTQTVRSDFMIVPGAEDNSNKIWLRSWISDKGKVCYQ